MVHLSEGTEVVSIPPYLGVVLFGLSSRSVPAGQLPAVHAFSLSETFCSYSFSWFLHADFLTVEAQKKGL